MDRETAAGILAKLPGFKVAVIGDYCLDKYVHVDPALAEISRETGRTAHQVTVVRTFPGAAGTVCANLASLGFGEVRCFGVTGDDGDGYELRRGLRQIGCGCGGLVLADRLTNTYMKPLDDEMRELDRMDFRTRSPVPEEIQKNLADKLEAALEDINAVVVVDQFDSADEGLISRYLLGRLRRMAENRPEKLFFCDSRARPGDFAGMTVKCNHYEAALSAGLAPDDDNLPGIAGALTEITLKPAYITCGEKGVIAAGRGGASLSPAIPAQGPLDIVGAGDAASGGIVAALCSGAPPAEAAFFANIVSSVTIKKLGVTGTASPAEVEAAAVPFTNLRPITLASMTARHSSV